MKKLIFSLSLVLLVKLAFAYPLMIQSWNIGQDVKTINALNLNIDRVSRLTGSIIVDVRGEQEEDLLLQHGFAVTRIPDQAREYYEYLVATTLSGDNPLDAYFSLAELHSFLQDMQDIYPNLCQLIQYGSSVQNRPLYAMKISDNVTQNEAEPEVKLIANIHGDEPIGYDMMIRTIELLTSEYGLNPRITDIVNNTELWIIPMMNPDGYANGVRYNAAGVDLNRNFPTPSGISNPDGNPHAPENLAMMDFSNQHNFVSGLSFHSGALVMNYPWDYSHALAPDNELLIDMSLTYSQHNLPMYNSNEFDQGITNGAAWYVITGSMQDWNYAFTNNIELTAELSNTKWPPASTLDSYWANNRESILSFIEYAQNGIKGLITDNTGVPIPGTITIFGNDKITRNDPVVGDYHRLLLPGEYEVKISAPGHLPQTASITVPAQGQAVHNVSLEPAMAMHLHGTLRDREGFTMPNVNILLTGDNQYNITTAADGTFHVQGIIEGDYQTSFSRDGQGTVYQLIELRQHRNDNHLVLVLDDPLFYEDFEDGLSDWTVTSPWATVQHGGSMVLTDSPGGNYGNNINRSIRLTEPVSLIGIEQAVLSFRAKWDLETGYDHVYLEGSSDGSNWSQLGSFTGNQTDWAEQFYALDTFAGADFYLRFRIRTDWSQAADGIYIDDVTISGRNLSLPMIGDVTQDGIIDGGDVQALLQYTVGGELSAEQLINADVDLTDGVKTVDAQQILHYMRNADFRFPAQSSVEYVLPEIELKAQIINDTLYIEFQPELRSLHLDIPYPIDGFYFFFQNDQPYFGQDRPNGLFSVVHDIPIAGNGYAFKLVNPDEDFVIDAEINGHPVLIEVGKGNSSPSESPALPLTLRQNYPNPFNPHTLISFYLPEGAAATLKIYNLKGQLIKTLIDARLSAGEHSFEWDGQNDEGKQVSAGIYLYRLQTPQQNITRKMVLSK